MRSRQTVFCVFVLGVVLSLVSSVSVAQDSAPQSPMGTAFTYQGRLEDGGGPVDGACDLRFKLYNAATAGTQIGGTQTLTGVGVSDGLFTVQLDFGTGAFNGYPRWLEIEVRCPSGSGSYVKLSPRQPLTPAPYALYAAGAGGGGGGDGTTYTAGTGLSLSGAEFSLRPGFRLPQGCTNGQIAEWNGSVWECGDDNAGGGGAHDHWGASWSGTGTGLTLNSSNGDGLRVSAGDKSVFVQSAGNPDQTTSSGESSGFEAGSAEGIGLFVNWANQAGVAIDATGGAGLWIGSPENDGVRVISAGDSGLHVEHATNGVSIEDAQYTGFGVTNAVTGFDVGYAKGTGVLVNSAKGYGVQVGSAGYDGVHVMSAADSGMKVVSAGTTGVLVSRSGWNGVVVEKADGDGARMTGVKYNAYHGDTTNASGEWGFHTPDKISASTVAMNALTLIAQVSGPESLSRGDLVSAAGVAQALPGAHNPLPLVRLAGGGGGIVGVVEGRMALTAVTPPEGVEVDERQPELRSAAGPARAGDYVALTVLGVAQVKVDSAARGLPVGTRLTAAGQGMGRPLKTIVVEGVTLAESAPALGTTLDAPDEKGLVWVLVNPQ